MKFSILILLIHFTSATFYAFGQKKVKPLFNSLEFASYERNDQNKPKVSFYISIDSAGKINIVDKRGTKTGYYSYMLPDSTIKLLNTIFNDTKPLKSYIVANKLEEGLHYAGDYAFVALHRKNKNNDFLTYIYPFMSDNFNDAHGAIIMTFDLSKNKTRQEIAVRKEFLDKLSEYDKKAINLPKKELPPPAME